MALFRNPPEADKSLRLPCEMQRRFLWGQFAELIVRRTICTPLRYSLISLTLRKIAHFCIGNLICAHFTFTDGHGFNL